MNEYLKAIIERSGRKRVYAFGGPDKIVEVPFAIRKGQKADPGQEIVQDHWTHACVEGDAEWTRLSDGVTVHSVRQTLIPWDDAAPV